MISKADLTTEVKCFGAKTNEGFKLVGYVEVKNGDEVAFHADLTQRSLDDEAVAGKTAEEIQEVAEQEASNIIELESTQNVLNDYITLKNLGLY